MASDSAEERLRQLDKFFGQGGKEKGSFSLETLLDALLVLYDECCNSTLRRDKNISEFIEHGKMVVMMMFRFTRDSSKDTLRKRNKPFRLSYFSETGSYEG